MEAAGGVSTGRGGGEGEGGGAVGEGRVDVGEGGDEELRLGQRPLHAPLLRPLPLRPQGQRAQLELAAGGAAEAELEKESQLLLPGRDVVHGARAGEEAGRGQDGRLLQPAQLLLPTVLNSPSQTQSYFSGAGACMAVNLAVVLDPFQQCVIPERQVRYRAVVLVVLQLGSKAYAVFPLTSNEQLSNLRRLKDDQGHSDTISFLPR